MKTGAGKSTLLEAIKERFGDAVVVVPEPVSVWTDVDGHYLLGEYYKNQQVTKF
jgi:thymidylate kinase